MKICDRCGPKAAIKATEKLIIEIEGQEFDLCPECLFDVIEFVRKKPKKGGLFKNTISLKDKSVN